MPTIINLPERDLKNYTPNNEILIRIGGGSGFKLHELSNEWLNIHSFYFEDCDENEKIIDPDFWFQEEQAEDILDILNSAKNNNLNVVVHCKEGISRSGAIVEFAKSIGFDTDPKIHREPNSFVLNILKKTNKQKEQKLAKTKFKL